MNIIHRAATIPSGSYSLKNDELFITIADNVDANNNKIQNIEKNIVEIDKQILKLQEDQKGIQLKGEVFNSSSDKVLYTDDFGVIGWEGGETRQPFYNPANGWSWHDGVAFHIKGGQGGEMYANVDDRSSTTDQRFYFTEEGTKNDTFRMENYGGYFMGTIIKEGHDASYPAYKVEILMGNTSSGAVIITKIKN